MNNAYAVDYNLNPPLFLLVFIVFFIFLYFYYNKIKRKHFNLRKLFIIGAILFYALSVFKLTLLPITIVYNASIFFDLPSQHMYQLNPFETITSSLHAGNYRQVVGNLIMLLPLPILIGVLNRRTPSFSKFFIGTVLLVLIIELAQLALDFITGVPNAVTDIDDFIMNVLGALLGWIIIKIYFLNLEHKKRLRRN
ncbi:VanZ family protein [Terribacillus sp. DMT04]|uniref:VanZ family protein n=1 Tax=Terribacillus sp. DMT04 TaxID=2850441 RepID=UPI001C2C14EB|nr:VanZ family protein [Terribacillus sp. DMT04]QXE02551.1 VanZ family protein [Terribacillus sp. DMT04]